MIDYRPVGEVKRLEEQVESKEKRRRVKAKEIGGALVEEESVYRKEKKRYFSVLFRSLSLFPE